MARKPKFDEKRAWSLALDSMSVEVLDDPDFRESWIDWCRYRMEIRKPLTETGLRRQIRRLEGFGLEGALASIDQSICGGWQGLFPAKRAPSGDTSLCGGLTEMSQAERDCLAAHQAESKAEAPDEKS